MRRMLASPSESADEAPSLREARRLLPGEALRRRRGSRHGRDVPLRLEGPDHPRRVRRHDRQRQDRTLRHPPGRGGDRRHPGDRARPQGRSRQPAADFSEAGRGRLPSLGGCVGRRSRGGVSRRPRRLDRGAVAKRPRRMEPGRRPDRAAAARGRVRYLHAGQLRRAAARSPVFFRRPAAWPARRLRWIPGTRERGGLEPAGVGRHRGRPDSESRAHPALERLEAWLASW